MIQHMENKPGIYAFRNKKNGRVYVGQSKQVLTRKRQHERGDTKNSTRFHNAMNKHGADGFDFVILEYCEVELLDEREVHWIIQLNSLYPNGYNLTTGGGALHQHHEETRKKFSENQKKKIAEGTHLYQSKEFIEKNRKYQIELGKLGQHSSQQPEFQEKRNKTVQERIAETGAFFKHSPETINLYRKKQQELYSKGKGKFQDPKLIEHNRQLVKTRLAEGTHHSQQPDWSARASKAAEKQKKSIVIAIRTDDGNTIEQKYPSINQAEKDLEMPNSHLSELCNDKDGVKTVQCKFGKVIRGTFGTQSNWDLKELSNIPDSEFTRMIAVRFTIETNDGKTIYKTYDGIRQGCRDLGADKSAVRWILKGEKYKSTKSNLGRIIKVENL